MSSPVERSRPASREAMVHRLFEAAELEHALMCAHLYAAFSLKPGDDEGLAGRTCEAVARWRRTILDVAIDDMARLAAVWNFTSARFRPRRIPARSRPSAGWDGRDAGAV